MSKTIQESLDHLKYICVGIVGCCAILVVLFIGQISIQNNMDEIFDEYDQEMAELHGWDDGCGINTGR